MTIKNFNLNMTNLPKIGQLLIFLFVMGLGIVIVVFVYKNMKRI